MERVIERFRGELWSKFVPRELYDEIARLGVWDSDKLVAVRSSGHRLCQDSFTKVVR